MTEVRIERDSIRRLQAFEDYFNLGPGRSPNALLRHYGELVEKTPELRRTGRIPSLSRNTVYAWAKEDKWEEKAARRDMDQIEADRVGYQAMRARGMDHVHLLIDLASEALANIIQTADDAVRLRAILAVYDRAGITPFDRIKGATPPRDPKDAERILPPADADDDTLIKWMNESRREEAPQ